MIIIYTTCKDKKEAEKISTRLLKKRLCACTNIFPIASMYWWEGSLVKGKEWAVWIKTKKGKFNEVSREIKKVHSYKTPCILSFAVKHKDSKYHAWLQGEVK